MKKHEESAHDTSSQEVELDEDALTRSIIGVFYKVFKGLKSGLPERIYVGALQIELEALGFTVAREVAIDVCFAGHRLGAYRVDLLVDQRVVVEVKATEELRPIDFRQTRNYVRLSKMRVGLLLHFGAEPKFYRFFSEADKQGVAIMAHSPIGPIRRIYCNLADPDDDEVLEKAPDANEVIENGDGKPRE